MKIEELDIEVEDVDEYNDEASEILTAYCEGLQSDGMTRSPTEDEKESWAEYEGIAFLWTDKAGTLISKKIDELYAIGILHFGKDADLDISSHMFKEP